MGHPVEGKRFEVTRVIDFTAGVFLACGATEDAARKTARHLIGADLRGVDTHGIVRLPLYVSRVQKGLMDARSAPELIRESATTAVFDGRNALGQYVAHEAMQRAIDKARDHDLGVVTVRHSNHYGAAAEYALMHLVQVDI